MDGFKTNFDYPLIMGVINLDEQSFYENSRAQDLDGFMNRVEAQIKEGADIIDIGPTSSRPGASLSKASEELVKLKKYVPHLMRHFPRTCFSIDTYHSEVADYCLSEGFQILNDISASSLDDKLLKVCKSHEAVYILMHMRGNPKNMQEFTYYNDIVKEIGDFFELGLEKLKYFGISQVFLDPGFGFGKSLNDNFKLLKNLTKFKHYNCPLLVGLSRKTMIQKTLDVSAEEALNGTTAAHVLALEQGANILRVHDVREAKEAVKIWSVYAAV